MCFRIFWRFRYRNSQISHVFSFRCVNSIPNHSCSCDFAFSLCELHHLHVSAASTSLHPVRQSVNNHVTTASITLHPDKRHVNIHPTTGATTATIPLHPDKPDINVHVTTAVICVHPDNHDFNIHVTAASISMHPDMQDVNAMLPLQPLFCVRTITT